MSSCVKPTKISKKHSAWLFVLRHDSDFTIGLDDSISVKQKEIAAPQPTQIIIKSEPQLATSETQFENDDTVSRASTKMTLYRMFSGFVSTSYSSLLKDP